MVDEWGHALCAEEWETIAREINRKWWRRQLSGSRSATEPSYEELAALMVGLVARVEALEAENAQLRRRLGMNWGNSSMPPSKDSIGAKAARRADRSSRERSNLADAVDAGMSWAQVWDILPVVLEKVHYLLPRRRCRCGRTTTAVSPFGSAGTVTYGPNLNAAVILLASEGNVPIERTAMLIEALADVPVSSGFVDHALERFAHRLAAGGFDDAMRTALRAQDVLCVDETPTNATTSSTPSPPGSSNAQPISSSRYVRGVLRPERGN